MPTAEDYRRQAETCLALALSTTDRMVVDKLRAMACDLMAKSLHVKDKSSEEGETVRDLPAYVTRRVEQPFLPPGSEDTPPGTTK